MTATASGARRCPGRRLRAVLLTVLVATLAACGQSRAPGLTIAAASSLRTVLPDLIAAAPAGGLQVHATYAASGILRQQVAAGAPIDLMIFAADQPIDRLIQTGFADPETRTVVATNQLVLISPRNAPPMTFDGLPNLPPASRLAIGDPRTVPVGQYARQALVRLHLWDRLRPQLVYGANVAAVLAYARRGEVEGAFVYATDARAAPDVLVTDRAHGDWAPSPLVVAALRPRAPEAAHRFLGFLLAERGQAILRSKGFGPPPGHAGS